MMLISVTYRTHYWGLDDLTMPFGPFKAEIVTDKTPEDFASDHHQQLGNLINATRQPDNDVAFEILSVTTIKPVSETEAEKHPKELPRVGAD